MKPSAAYVTSTAIVLFVFLLGFTAGTHYERAGHEEFHKASDCPEGTWGVRECVPYGCSWDFRTHDYDCRGDGGVP